LGHLIDRHVFRTRDLKPFVASPGEKRWFLVYAPAAFVARMVMLFGIALMVAGQFFFIGVLLAAWALWTGLALPLWKMGAHVFASPQLHQSRGRAIRLTQRGGRGAADPAAGGAGAAPYRGPGSGLAARGGACPRRRRRADRSPAAGRGAAVRRGQTLATPSSAPRAPRSRGSPGGFASWRNVVAPR
jgi:putative peptide zinc metalloprotease protein